MKKRTLSLLGITLSLLGLTLMIGSIIGLAACLNPTGVDPDAGLKLPDKIETVDVTAAVLMLTNRSRTVDVTNVTITQPEWKAPEENPSAQQPSISFTNKPRRLEKKAQYLTPSDDSYQVVIDYAFDSITMPNGSGVKTLPAGTGTQTVLIPAPLPKQIVEYIIYRNDKGIVIIDKEAVDPDPADTGNPAIDPLPGEGSSPAVISAENRGKMGTFVVVSKTNSQIIDSVEFKMGSKKFTMGRIGAHDKQSIALGQGSWETRLSYTKDGVKTLGPLNSIIVPSNDPQAVQEHYLYFYLTKRGDYAISQEWPPFPNDVEEEDVLPLDNGYGRGLIKIVNNSYALAEMVIIHNLKDTSRFPFAIAYESFTPPVPIQYNRTGYIDVVGTEGFPIEAHEGYLIQVRLEGNEVSGIVERKAYIKDQVVTIIISASDLHFDNSQGAKVTIENNTKVWPVEITNLTVKNKLVDYQSSYFNSSSWAPQGVIVSGESAEQYVKSTTAMPISPGAQFDALVAIQGNGITRIVTKAFNPAELYSELSPNENTRTITISDTDIPKDIKDALQSVNVTLQNRISSWPVEIIGMTVRNKANTSQNTVYGDTTWTPNGAIVRGGDAVQTVRASMAMPISPGVAFEAQITLYGSGKTATIIKSFSPAELYSDDPPAQNIRTLTINDGDVPNSIKDAFILTRGAKVTIENKVNSWPVQIIGMDVQNKANPAEKTSYNTISWIPRNMIGNNQSAVQMVMSSVAMPIKAGVEFNAVLYLFGNGQQSTVTIPFSPAVLYSTLDPEQNPRTITITDSEVPDEIKPPVTPPVIGARFTIENKVSGWPVEIKGLTIRNKVRTSESSFYDTNNWTPKGRIEKNSSAVQDVFSSTSMPIIAGEEFEALIALSGSGMNDTITKAFSPAELYSTLAPSQNTRIITITDFDVPDSIKDAYILTRGAKVTIENHVVSWPIQIIGMTVFNNTSPTELSSYNNTTWEPKNMINNSQNAVQMVMSSTTMPIKPGATFNAAIILFGNGKHDAVTKFFSPADLYSTLDPEKNTRTITITDSDIPPELKTPVAKPDPTQGATVTLENKVNSWPVKIIGMTVRNKANNDEKSFYDASNWTPHSDIQNGGSAVQEVLGSTIMPITAGAEFEAVITLYGSGAADDVVIPFSPAILFSADPAHNFRTITIKDGDVPDSIKDAYILTRGAKVTIENNVSAKWPVQIISMTVLNKATRSEHSDYSSASWEPHSAIGNSQKAVQMVMSSAAMPITASAEFEAVIQLFGNGNTATVTKSFIPAVLYSTLSPEQNTRTITITDSDMKDEIKVPDTPAVIGAKITLENKVSEVWPVQIMSMTVQNKNKIGESTSYGATTWEPYNMIDKGRSAVQMVLSSAAMPIRSGDQFEAIITLYGSGSTATVTKAISPATLYSTLSPEQNTRTITIGNGDVPDKIKDAYTYTRGAKVTIVNHVSAKWPVQITEMTVRNKTSNGQNTPYTSATWEPRNLINNGGSAVQMVSSSPAMPIRSGVEFEAVIKISGNGNTAYVTKAFIPAVLYSTVDPEQNTRTITIGDSDIPIALQKVPSYETDIPGLDGSTDIGKVVSIDGYEWYVVEKEIIGDKTYVMLACKSIMAYGVVFNDPRNSNYNESDLQAVMTRLYNKMVQMKKIAVLPNMGDHSQGYLTQPTTTMADTVIRDVFFAPTYRDALEMGKQAYNYGGTHWWTRSPITHETVWEVSPDGVIGLTVTNATGIGAVPGVWVRTK